MRFTVMSGTGHAGCGRSVAQSDEVLQELQADGATAGVFDKSGQTIPELDLEGIDALIGDASKAREVLGWEAATKADELARMTAQLRAIDSRMPGVAERIRTAMAQRIAANRVASG